MTIALRVLGPLRLDATDGRDLESLVRQPKRTALLAYLAAAAPRGFHRRDTLLALFWPELDDAHARAALNQSLYVLRNALGEQAIVTRGEGDVGLSEDVVWCDAAAFEAALDAGRPADALVLYGGDLLAGFFIPGGGGFERWLEVERERLRHRASDGAWAIAETRAAEGDHVAATRWARRAADLLPADEAVVRRLMTFLRRVGDRAAAIRAYEAFAWQLSKEYEVEPSAETQALALALREEGRRPADVRPVKLGSAPAILVAIRRGVPLWWAAVAILVVTGLVAGVALLLRPGAKSHPPVVRFSLQFPGVTLITGGVPGSTIALSPGGDRLVYLAMGEQGTQLFQRAMDRLESVPIPHTLGAHLPFFSPDGMWLGFVAEGRIRKVPVAGGPAITVCLVEGSAVLGASWGAKGDIVFATAAALMRVPSAGGKPAVLAVPDTAAGVRYRWPEVLPGGRAVVFTQVDRTGLQLAVVSLATGAARLLGQEGTNPHFVAPGYLVFARQDGALLAASFDEGAPAITGPVLPVAEGVAVGFHGAAKVGVARNGVLALVPERLAGRSLVEVDRDGTVRAVQVPPQAYQTARYSPDTRRIVTDVVSPEGAQRDVAILDVEQHTLRRVTLDSGSASADWTPDGRRIVFATSSGGRLPGFEVRWVLADGGDSAETLLAAEHSQVPDAFAPDGRALIVQRNNPETRLDLWILPLDGERRARPYLRTPFSERGAAVSPDGRWLAYTSDESGRDEVYVRSFPVPGAAVRVSERGGREPRWARSGRELFYRAPAGMAAAAFRPGTGLIVQGREVLFDDSPYVAIPNGAGYDVHPDGRHFLMIRRGPQQQEVVVVLNWFDQLRTGRR